MEEYDEEQQPSEHAMYGFNSNLQIIQIKCSKYHGYFEFDDWDAKLKV